MHSRIQTPREPVVFAAVLAAGRSLRFGRSKLLETLDGQPLVRRAADVARGACGDRSILVTGHDSATVVAAAGDAPQFVIVNDHHEEGMGGSIALAARAVAHTADALLILFADQPLVTVQHAAALTGAWSGAQDEIVATAFAGTTGPPVLFPRGAFDALAALSGDTGAKRILEDAAVRVRTVRFEDAAIDIDTPADLEKLRK
jgi:molybdenum cofactor cytidylyltransferase